MIGMMYLVLTAMLAMNVSKDVLNAFVLVDAGLTTTTENFHAKSEGLYGVFDEQMELNPDKVGDWKEKADDVRETSDELYEFINECKVAILSVKEEDAIHEGETELGLVKGKDDTNVPAQIMLLEKKGEELKAKIDAHQEHLLSMIDDHEKYAVTVEAIESNLNTELPEVHMEHGGGKNVHPTWESTYFEHLPLASVITLLSKMQGDVRNVEEEMLNYLLGQIDAGDFKVNVLEAVVIPNTSYVFKGQEYRAEIFLAAYDSTKMPKVVLKDGTELDVQSGKGIYRTTSNTVGMRQWGGTIQLENDGMIIEREFNAEFEVAEANATISATAMNVFYRGVPNPVAISAGGVAERDVEARISSGNISRTGAGMYVVKPGAQGDLATVSVYAKVDGSSKLMNKMDFRVKDLPTPNAIVEGVKGPEGNLTLGQLSSLKEVRAEAEDFLFDVKYQVLSFTVAFQGSGGIWNYEKSESGDFTARQKEIFRALRAGQRVMIEKIKATGPDGKVRTLNNITITVI